MSPESGSGSLNVRRWTNPDLIASAVLVAAGVLFFGDALFTSKNFYFRDILNFHYPLRKLLVESFARGEFPLWNPFIYLGQPLLANPNYLAFYPTNLFHLILPFNYAFKMHFIVHPIAGGVGLYFLQRRLGLSPVPASGGALAYEFSGTVLSFLNLYNIVPVVALMPWIGWAFLGALERLNWRRIVIFGFLLGIQVVALEPMMFQCVAWMLLGLAVHQLWEARSRAAMLKRQLWTAVPGGAIAFALSAVQTLPTLELLPLSARSPGFSYLYSSVWSVRPLDLLNTFIPKFYGTHYTILNASSWGETLHAGREPYLVSYFMGACTLILAVSAIGSRRKRLWTVLAGLTLVSLFLSLGQFNPLHRWLFDHVFLFRMGRYPSKYFLLATLSVSLLASLGLEAIGRREELRLRVRRRIAACAAAGTLAALLAGGAWFCFALRPGAVENWLRGHDVAEAAALKDYPRIASQLHRSVLSSCAFLAVASGTLLLVVGRRRAGAFQPLLVVLLAAEVISQNLGLVPLISDADVSFLPPINAFLGKESEPELKRVLPSTIFRPIPKVQLSAPNSSVAWLTLFCKVSGYPFWGIAQGVQYSIDKSVDFLNTFESDELAKQLLMMPEPARIDFARKLNTPLIMALGAVTDPGVRPLAAFPNIGDVPAVVYSVEGAAPRAYFATGVEMADSHRNAAERFVRAGFDFRNTVVLEGASHGSRPAAEQGGAVRVVEYRNSSVACEVAAEAPGYLVLLDSHYPGWLAYVDGARTPIHRANYAFRAVEVPAGRHSVEFRFSPSPFYSGLAITLVALLAGIGALIRGGAGGFSRGSLPLERQQEADGEER